MTAEERLAEDAVDVDEAAFPPTWQQGDQRLSLTYRFEPGAPDDGVTVQVPLALLARLSPAGFDWQVPGMRRDLVTAMIKALPKALRKNVVPAADWADRLLEGLPEPDPQHPVAFTTTIAGLIMRKAHVRVADDDFDLDRIPAHLRMAFRVVDERGREVAAGRDLTELQARLSSRARDSVARATARPVERVAGASGGAPRGMERTGLTTCDLDELPRFVDTAQGGTGDSLHVIRAYPALVDEGSPVAIRLMATAEDQARAMPGGVRRLLVLAIANPSAYVKQHLTSQEKLMLATSPYPNVQALFDDCLLAAIDQVLERVAPGGAIYSKELFETARDRVSGVVMDSMFDTVSRVNRILTGARDAARDQAGHEHAADRRAHRRARAARRPRAPGLRLGHRSRPAPAPACLPVRTHPPCAAPARPARARPRVDDRGAEGHRPLPRGRRRHPVRAARARVARARPLDARGAAPQPLRPAPAHGRAGVAAADPQGARGRRRGSVPAAPDAARRARSPLVPADPTRPPSGVGVVGCENGSR